MAIRFYSPNVEAAARRLGILRDQIPQMIGQALISSAELVVASAKVRLSGPVLKVKTGQLRAEVRREAPVYTGPLISIAVGVTRASDSSGPGMYGSAWEFGYSVPATVLRPKTKKAMAFMWWPTGSQRSMGRYFVQGAGRSGEIIAKSIMRPAYSVWPRPWLRPSVIENLPQIFTLLSNIGITMRIGKF